MSDVSVITPGPQGPPQWRPLVAWTANTAYFKPPWGSAVYYEGSLYECRVDHTSGTDFAADLAAERWQIAVSAQLNAEWQAIVDANFAAAAEANATAQAAAEATAADREQTGLDALATYADRVQAGEDRQQTGLDRVAAAISATAAAVSEANAAASITYCSSRSALAAAMVPGAFTYANLAGYYTPGDGGGALYKRVVSEPSHNGKVQSADGAWWEIASPILSPRQFGAVSDDETKISVNNQAISDAILCGAAQLKDIDFGWGVFSVSQSFTFDPSKVRLITDHWAALSWAADPTTFGVNIVGTASYTNIWRQNSNAIVGLTFIGGAQGSVHTAAGIKIGDGTNVTAFIGLDRVSIQGFATTVQFTDNVYRVTIIDPRFVWGVIKTPSSITNFGEAMIIRGGFIADTNQTYNEFLRGEWKVYGTSFDNAPIKWQNDVQFDMFGGHFENPGGTIQNPRYGEASGEAIVNINGAWICWNATTAGLKLTRPLFLVNTTANRAVGISFNDCTMVQGGNYSPQDGGYPHQSLCEGTGRVTVRGMKYLGWSNFQYLSIGEGANVIRNGDFETGDVSGWTLGSMTGTGTWTFAADGTVKKFGTYGGKISATWSSGGSAGKVITQRIAVRPGDIIVGGAWFKCDWDPSGSKGQFSFGLKRYNASGVFLENSTAYKTVVALTDWTYYRFGEIVPSGVSIIDLEIVVLANSAATSVNAWMDSIMLNVIPG